LSRLHPPVKVCAVSYLNTSPLVWGMLHGDQRGAFDLTFRVPSECASAVASGEADIGIIPAIELNRHDYGRIRGLGIASRGPVRSILLVSSKPFGEIETLAGDTSSRTSVALARVILARRYGAQPRLIARPPDLVRMLEDADAGLIIGDPALHLDPAALGDYVLDLGAEEAAGPEFERMRHGLSVFRCKAKPDLRRRIRRHAGDNGIKLGRIFVLGPAGVPGYGEPTTGKISFRVPGNHANLI